MILVFMILGIIIMISIFIFLLTLSTLKIELNQLHIAHTKGSLKVELILNLTIYLFNQFKLIQIRIDHDRIKNLLSSGKLDIQKFKENKAFNQEVIKAFKKIPYKIEVFRLEGYFATVDEVVSSSIYAMVNAIIPILIAPRMQGKYKCDFKFLTIHQNTINLDLTCIISVKMVNIINRLYYLKKKGGKKNHGKSSHRRSYAYSNE